MKMKKPWYVYSELLWSGRGEDGDHWSQLSTKNCECVQHPEEIQTLMEDNEKLEV